LRLLHALLLLRPHTTAVSVCLQGGASWLGVLSGLRSLSVDGSRDLRAIDTGLLCLSSLTSLTALNLQGTCHARCA
jgi:hypothetical protein